MRSYVRVSGFVFGLVAIIHLIRTFTRWPLLIAGHPVPAAVSLIVFLAAGAMTIWAWRLLSQPTGAG